MQINPKFKSHYPISYDFFELIKAIHSLIKSYCHLLPSKMKVLFIYFKFLYNFYLHFLFVNLLIFMIDS